MAHLIGLSVIATGQTGQAGSGDLNIIGNNLSLIAADNLLLQAAENLTNEKASNSSSSLSVGATFSVGQKFGLSFQLGASGSLGNGNGEANTYSNSHVVAGNQLYLESGHDTRLIGAVAAGRQVVANVGTAGQGNLTLTSLQDSNRYNSDQKSLGVSLDLCIPPICVGGSSSASVSANASRINSNFLSVVEQTGLKAGDGGFQVNVAGHTGLTGAVIASSPSAVDLGLNSLITQTLSSQDLQNRAAYKGSSLGVSVSTDFKLGEQSGGGTAQTSNTNAPNNAHSADAGISFIPAGGAGYGQESGKAASTTFSAISGGAITITNDAAQKAKTGLSAAETVASLNRDTANAENALSPIFDKDKVQNSLDAQVAITQAFGRDASKAVGDYAASQIKQASALMEQADKTSDPAQQQALRDQAQAINAQWGENGTLRIAAHTVIGGLTGNLQGAAGALVGTLTAPAVANALQQAGITGILATALTQIASTASGYAAGGGAGGASAFNEVTNNYLKHDEINKYLAIQQACQKNPKGCSDAQQAELDKLNKLSTERDQAVDACLADRLSCGNQSVLKEVRQAAADLMFNPVNGDKVFSSRTIDQALKTLDQGQFYKNLLTDGATHFVGNATMLYELLSFAGAKASDTSKQAIINALVQGQADKLGNIVGEVLGGTAGQAYGLKTIGVSAAALPGILREAQLAKATQATATTWKSASQLSPADANQLLMRSLPADVEISSIGKADILNLKAKLRGYDEPLIAGSHVVDLVTTQPTKFVRVYAAESESKQVGSWMMRAEDVVGLSAEQIAKKFSLPQVPNMQTDVTIPSGINLQASVASNILKGANGGGGGVQFQVQATFDRSWFTNARKLP